MGLSIFLFIIFCIFGYLLISSLTSAYSQLNDAILSTAIKELRHDFNIDINNTHEFEDIKHEFDIDILYSQIVVLSNNSQKIISKSKDLKNSKLYLDSTNIEELNANKIYFSLQTDTNLTFKQIKVATIVLEQNKNETIILQCGIPFSKYNPYIKNIELTLLIGLPLLLSIILSVVYWIISKSLGQTKIILDEVKNIKIDGSKTDIKKTGIANEIDDLIETFNILIDNLQSSYKKGKEFGQNASHELKTPLTVIKGEIEVGLRRTRTIQEYQDIMYIIQSELFSLQDTIEKILFLSNNDEIEIKKSFTDIYIDEVLMEVIDEKTSFAKTKNISIKLLQLEPQTILGNHTLLKVAISNLIDNAIKYSHPNSDINICLLYNSLIIEDFGVGIASNEINKIFDRFYRVDKVRGNSSGSGLGLSIVKTILYIHNFNVTISSIEHKNTKVIISF